MNSFALPTTWINRPINITLVGAGGTGSALLTELFQMSFLLHSISDGQVYFNVTVYDHDEVSIFNVGRQAFFSHDVGLNKASTLVDRFNVFGGLDWVAKPLAFVPNRDNLKGTDLLITCVDSAKVRTEIATYGKECKSNWENKNELLWLDTGNSKYDSQQVLGHLFNRENKLPNIFDLYPSLADVVDVETDSCSHESALQKQSYGINKMTAIDSCSLVWQLIREGKIDRHGSFINIKNGCTTPLKIDPVSWSMLGYVENEAEKSVWS
jgi:PRTRC genetic system ThiF family protein